MGDGRGLFKHQNQSADRSPEDSVCVVGALPQMNTMSFDKGGANPKMTANARFRRAGCDSGSLRPLIRT